MKISEMKHPFGQGYKERNLIEDYLRQIFKAVDDEDGLALVQLYEEMTLEQKVFINGLLASHTRARIKEFQNSATVMRQCKPTRRTKHQGCGKWKPLNKKNFRENRHLCRECENKIDHERKHPPTDILMKKILRTKL